jgi:hypothetical protein
VQFTTGVRRAKDISVNGGHVKGVIDEQTPVME